MRASRLLSVLLLLQNRGQMSADELAGELEVSLRTVYRDIDSLSAAGVPVYAERGRHGGFRLLEGYRTRLTGMSEQEAQSLALAGVPAAASELGLGTVLAAARLKLDAAMPPPVAAEARKVAERFHLDAPGWFRDIESVSHLGELADAVWHAHRIDVRYRKWGNHIVNRELEPLGLVLKAGSWYLAARAAGAPRTYRVSRILELRVGAGRFERGEFDLAAYWHTWSEQFERRMYPRVAVVRMSAWARDLVPAYLGAVGVRAVEETAQGPDEHGWSRVELPVEPGAAAVGELLRFGGELEVMAPDELRADVAAAVRKMSERYG